MTQEEYNLLFHREQLNLVAFKRLMDCDQEVLRLVNKAIEAEREACAKIAKQFGGDWAEDAIRARGQA
jgi:hypothetical protein